MGYEKDISDNLRHLERRISDLETRRMGPVEVGPGDGSMDFVDASGRVMFRVTPGLGAETAYGDDASPQPVKSLLESKANSAWVQTRFEGVDGRLNGHDGRMDTMQADIDTRATRTWVQGNITTIVGRLDGLDGNIASHNTRINTAQSRADAGYDRAGRAIDNANDAHARAAALEGRASTLEGNIASHNTRINNAQSRANDAYDRAGRALDNANAAYALAQDALTAGNDAKQAFARVDAWLRRHTGYPTGGLNPNS